MHKMFGSKTSSSSTTTTSTSTFYTNLESTDDKNEETTTTIIRNYHENPRDSVGAVSDDYNSQDSDSIVCNDDQQLQQNEQQQQQQKYTRHSFHRISSFSGFPRFQHFIMSASSPTDNTINVQQRRSIVSHSVLEYKTSRYSVTQSDSSSKYTSESYELSESESDEEESDETRSSEIDISSVIIPDEKYNKTTIKNNNSPIKKKKDTTDVKRKKKLENIANELLETEKKYVCILHLIDQVFQFRVDQENRAHPMFSPETVQKIFSNIKSIYIFHHDFLLPQLQERINSWNDNSRIGDIMKNNAPFLKMYTEYVKNFDDAMNLISKLQQKIPKFANIINDIQKLDECGKLALSHHMLSPIQRLPRYELLLKDYLRNLTDDNPDYNDSKKALELVSIAANHTNEAMKKIDKFKKLLEIQDSICNVIDLVSRTRELVKEGSIVKISARSGDHQDRYLFLFNDILLLCSIRQIPPRTPPYYLRAKFLIENLEIAEGDNLETANTFYIRDGNKSVELYTESADEKTNWLDALFQTMHEIIKRKASLKTTDINKQDYENRCMVCDAIFTVIKRKHHCRSCNCIVCNKCSNQKIVFEDNKQMRVCRLCYDALILSNSPSSPPPSSTGPVPSLLRVSAQASCVLSGSLLLKTQATKPWKRRWFALHSDFVLYSFDSEKDKQALTATPMPGYSLTEGNKLPEEDALNPKDRKGTFKIHHSRKCYYLHATTPNDKDKWINALRLAMKAELPSQNTSQNNHVDDKSNDESINDSLN